MRELAVCAFAGLACATPPGPRAGEPSASIAERIPTTWQQLESMADAIYTGPWSYRGTAETYGCVDPARVVHGRGALVDGAYCVANTSVIDGAVWAAAPGADAWVVAVRTHAGVVNAVAGTREALLEKARCGLLDQVWQTMPAAHRQCTTDADCTVLTAMCFAAPVAIGAAGEYRDVLARFGGTCLDPAGGACPAEPTAAACRSGRCERAE